MLCYHRELVNNMDSCSVMRILLSVIQYFLTTAAGNLQVHTEQITFNKHGYVVAESQLPTCGSSGIIHVLSCKYLPCTSCNSASEQTLSPAAEMIIHEMCSLKQTCVKSMIPTTGLHSKERTVVEMKYQCLGQFEMFVDICGNTTKTVDNIIRMLYRENSESFEICHCSIKGRFSLALTDIRLKSAYTDQCSPAKLQVLYQTYACDDAKDGYGSVYSRNVGEGLSEGLVFFTTDYANVEPEMVYLTIKPTGYVELSCAGKPRYMATSSIIETATPISPTKTDANSTDGDSANTTTTLIMAIAGPCAILVLVCVVLFVRHQRRNWKETSRINHLERLVTERLRYRHGEQPDIRNLAPVNDATDAARFTEDGGVYVDLKQNQGAAANADIEDMNYNDANIDQTTTSTCSYYDHLNEQKPISRSIFHKLLGKKDTDVYSYAIHQPQIGELVCPDMSTCHRSRDQMKPPRNEVSHVNNRTRSDITSTRDANRLSEIHAYVKLLPMQESVATSHNDDCVNPAHHTDQKEMKISTDNHPKQQQSKKYGIFKTRKARKGETVYSYASGALENRNHTSQVTTKAMATTDVDSTVDTTRFKENQGNAASLINKKVLTSNDPYNDRYKTIDMQNPTYIDSHNLGDSTHRAKFKNFTAISSITKELSAQATRTSEKGNSVLSQVGNASSQQELNTILVKANNECILLAPKDSDNNPYDKTDIDETMKHNDSKYDRLVKTIVSKSRSIFTNRNKTDKSKHASVEEQQPGIQYRAESDDDLYDKIKDDGNLNQNHPNYDKLTNQLKSDLKSLFQKKV